MILIFQSGAYLQLQVSKQVLNEELRDKFNTWYPGFVGRPGEPARLVISPAFLVSNFAPQLGLGYDIPGNGQAMFISRVGLFDDRLQLLANDSIQHY